MRKRSVFRLHEQFLSMYHIERHHFEKAHMLLTVGGLASTFNCIASRAFRRFIALVFPHLI